MRISDWSSDVCSSDLEFTLSAAAEVPAGQGTIVAVEWDFDGTGRFPVAEEGVDGTAESGSYERHHSYDKSGTEFEIVCVRAYRQGDTEKTDLRRTNKRGRAHGVPPVTNAHLV